MIYEALNQVYWEFCNPLDNLTVDNVI